MPGETRGAAVRSGRLCMVMEVSEISAAIDAAVDKIHTRNHLMMIPIDAMTDASDPAASLSTVSACACACASASASAVSVCRHL